MKRILFFSILASMLTTTVSLGETYVATNGQSYMKSNGKWYTTDDGISPRLLVETSAIIVRMVDENRHLTTADILAAGVADGTLRAKRYSKSMNVVDVPAKSDPFPDLERMQAHPAIENARFARVATLRESPDDQHFVTEQWNLADNLSGAPSAWDIVRDASNVLIGFYDSGTDLDHPDLVTNLWVNNGELGGIAGYDDDQNGCVDDIHGCTFPGGDGDVEVSSVNEDHGVNVTGIAAALTENSSTGVAGVAGGWVDSGEFGAKIVTLKDGPTACLECDMVDGIQYAMEIGVDVLNIGFGFLDADSTDFPELDDIIEDAAADEMVIVVPSQFSNFEKDYPTSDYNTIAVAAFDQNETLEPFSGNGDFIDLIAFSGVATTAYDDSYQLPSGVGGGFSGTSAAAPHVTGTAALMLAANPTLGWEEVRAILRETAEWVPGMGVGNTFHKRYGHGRLNILKAVAAAKYNAEVVESSYSTTETLPTGVYPNLYLPGDLKIESTGSITIAAGTEVFASTFDNNNLGTWQDDVEWIVEGNLTVLGTAADTVHIGSGGDNPAAGDWNGILVESTGVLQMDFASISHSGTGIFYQSDNAGHIKNTRFEENSGTAIIAGEPTPGGDIGALTIHKNDIDVGSPYASGIILIEDVDDVVVTENTIDGGNASLAHSGIHLGATNGSPLISDNDIESFLTGKGIHIGSTGGTPLVTKNAVDDCKYGIEVFGGTPKIGDDASDSDNIIQNSSSQGVRSTGTGTNPRIRNNQILSCFNGIVAQSGSNPDIGVNPSKGLNSILNSTKWCVWNRTSSIQVFAQGNYFGACPGGIPPVCWNGNVNVDFPECSQPASSAELEITTESPSQLLLSVSPNPVSQFTSISFALDQPSHVEIQVFDVSGKIVLDLGSFDLPAGRHSKTWDGRRGDGRPLGLGVHFVRLRVNGDAYFSKVVSAQ